PHPALHSFPTRRSSDLRPTREKKPMFRIVFTVAVAAAAISAHAQMTEDTARSAAQEVRMLVTEGTGVIGDLQPAINGGKSTKDQDRKSTRLNSSHVAIS